MPGEGNPVLLCIALEMGLWIKRVFVTRVRSLDEGFEELGSFFTVRHGLASALLKIFQSRFD